MGIVLLGVAQTAIVTRALSIGSYAAWATVFSLLSLSTVLTDLGLSPVVMRWIGNPDLRPPSPLRVLRIRFGLSVAVYVCVVVGSWLMRGETAIALALVLGTQALSGAMATTAAIWLQAHHRQHRQSLAELATTFIATGMLAVAAILAASPPLLALFALLLPRLALAIIAQRQLRAVPGIDQDMRSEVRIRSVWREALPLGGAAVLTSAYSRIDVLFVNAAENSSGVARYLFAYQFLEQALYVAAILAVTLMPLVVRRASRVDLLTDIVLRQTMSTVAVIGICMSAILALLSEPLVALIGGARFHDARNILVVLCPTIAGLFLNFFSGYVYIALGQGRRYLWINLLIFCVNLTGNALFTLRYGASAAAQVTWFTELLVISLNLLPMALKGGVGLLRPVPQVLLLVAACEAIAVLGAPVVVLVVPIAVTVLVNRRDLARLRELIVRRSALR